MTDPATTESAEQLVRRNALYLLVAQVLVVPLSVLTNVLVARFLGPAQFGHLYLATTFAGFGFLIVEWGQGSALTGLVAAHRQRSGELLGSTLAWRALAVLPVSAVLLAVSLLMGHPREVTAALVFTLILGAFATVCGACNDLLRGHERTDVGAVTYVAWKLLLVVVSVPVLLLHGGLLQLLAAQALCMAVGAVVMLVLLRRIAAVRPRVSWPAMRELVVVGTPFLALALALALQENVDAAFLSRLASADAVGWHAAARRLIGLLVFPANALIASLYPTLSRLHGEDPGGCMRAAGSALRMTVLCAVPLAMGCLLFPGLGIWVFDSASFGPTSVNLRILSAYLLLLYFSMPLGTLLMVIGRRRSWVALQLLCVVISAALDPWLIPLCESRFGNGGLGVCAVMVASEMLMVGCAVYLAPRSLFDRSLARSGGVAVLGGIAMVAVALLLRDLSAWVVAPLAVVAYGLVLSGCGALHPARVLSLLRRQA